MRPALAVGLLAAIVFPAAPAHAGGRAEGDRTPTVSARPLGGGQLHGRGQAEVRHWRTLSRRLVRIRMPRTWDASVTPSLGGGGFPLLVVANFRLPSRDADGPSAAAGMPPGGVRLILGEVGNVPDVGSFAHARPPIRMRARDFVASFPGLAPTHALARRHFSTSGRSFFLLVEFGSRPAPSVLQASIDAILRSLRIQPAASASVWRSLHRPLYSLSASDEASCPRTLGGRAAPEVGITLGVGPAYPVMGMTDAPPALSGVVRLRANRRIDGFYTAKTLWAIARSYRGPLLIRARGVGASRPAFVAGRGGNQAELRIPPLYPDQAPEWRYAPTTTLLARPGCYAFQIDGSSFSRQIVFRAVH